VLLKVGGRRDKYKYVPHVTVARNTGDLSTQRLESAAKSVFGTRWVADLVVFEEIDELGNGVQVFQFSLD
jgi:2'-5' RNA ligase